MRHLDSRPGWHWPQALTTAALALTVLTPGARGQPPLFLTPEAQEAGPAHRFDFLREESTAQFMTYRALNVRPHFSGAAYYDDNITLAPDNGSRPFRRDWVWSLSPGLFAGLGDFRPGAKGTFLSLDYTPTVTLYTTHGDFNALDHQLSFDTGWKGARTTLGLGQSYLSGSGGFVETGGLIDRDIYNTDLTASYRLSDKTSFDLNGRQTISRYETGEDTGTALNDRNEWAVEGFAYHAYSPKLRLGAGLVLGWRDVRDSPNERYEEILTRAAYVWTEKVDLTASVGARLSQFQGGHDDGPRLVFDLGGTWEPREATAISLEAYRRDESSVAFAAQNYTLTGLRAAVRQTLRKKWVPGLAIGYERSDYRSTVSGDGTGQDNDYWFIGPTLEYDFSDQWVVGVFYQFREKISDDADFSFANHQAGLRATFHF